MPQFENGYTISGNSSISTFLQSQEQFDSFVYSNICLYSYWMLSHDRRPTILLVGSLKEEFLKGMVPELRTAGADVISCSDPWHAMI